MLKEVAIIIAMLVVFRTQSVIALF